MKRSSFTFRQEIPKHATISTDGSLLAVLFGKTINLHDSSAGGIVESINSSQIRSPEQLYFVGRSSRYLVIKGSRDIVLWDIVRRSGKCQPSVFVNARSINYSQMAV